ncbi:MAG: hypothetical protein MRJ93_05485 [Nitrososphaeraceae archaeon]|nr:hypothetical protein [Nitrososphaeraceae archaeon]
MRPKYIKCIYLFLAIVGSTIITLSGENYINAQDDDPLQIVSNIKNLLNQTMTEYKSQNYTGASELVDIAYIDNYEYIEDQLKELDKDLMEDTEIMIREDFSNAVNDQESIKDINALYTQIKNNLDMIENLFKNK